MEYRQGFFWYTAVIKLSDAAMVYAAWHLGWWIRFDLALLPITKGIPPHYLYTKMALPLVIVFSAVFHIIGAYRKERVPFGFRAIKKVFEGACIGCLIFIALCYFTKQTLYSRWYLVTFVGLVICLTLLERGLLQLAWQWAQNHLIKKHRLLLIGDGALLQQHVLSLKQHRPYPIHWVGRLGKKEPHKAWKDIPYLGEEDRLEMTIDSESVEHVTISYPPGSHSKYAPILSRLENRLITVKVIPDFGKYNTFTYRADDEFGIPLLHFNVTPLSATDRVFKRIEDLLIATLSLILFAPIFLLASALIKLSSKGPIFFTQERVGADGRRFHVWKFRTMKLDAESETGPTWAKPDDPRVTPIGRWLRKTSLDELPQLFNVLKGEMSCIGPRPERPHFVDQFKKDYPRYMLRHKMKSGMTGWAQVNGLRGNTSLEERLKYDLYYIGHWSHLFDLKILGLTVFRGFVDKNAY